ncbi:MAG: hypothetical protein WDZ52_11965 [Pseudohongiellaceae bacterium]
MDTVSAPYRNIILALILLAGAIVLGFWQTYFSVLSEAPVNAHAHGISMILWLGLLLSQVILIRSGRRDIHRQLGKTSYLLVPLIVVSTLSFANLNLVKDGLTPPRLYIFYIQLQLLIVFVIAYGSAIYWKRNQAMHMRFMICTALTMIDPVVARVILFYVWEPSNFAYLQMITYSITDIILLGLIFSNLKRERTLKVYPLMLGVFVLFQVPNFLITDSEAWRSFSNWFMGLPFS